MAIPTGIIVGGVDSLGSMTFWGDTGQIFAFALPLCILAYFGRDGLFQMTASRLDRDPARKRRDGAFIAALLEETEARLGQTRWLHREAANKDHRFSPSDVRHNWKEGVVTDIGIDFILVQERGTSGPPVVHKLPRRTCTMTVDQLMADAAARIQFIPWSSMSLELMESSSSDGSGALAVPLRHKVLDCFLSHSWHDSLGYLFGP